MFCPNCGSSVADGQAFCHNCGNPIFQKALDEVSAKSPSINELQTVPDSKVKKKICRQLLKLRHRNHHQ